MSDTVDLRALGKYWGTLREGKYLEVRRHDNRVAWIDLPASAAAGRPVVRKDAPEAAQRGARREDDAD